MNRLYRKEIKEFFNILSTHHVAKLEKPDDSVFGRLSSLYTLQVSCANRPYLYLTKVILFYFELVVFGSSYHGGGLIARGGTAIRESLSSPSDLTGRIPWRKRSTREIQDPNLILSTRNQGGDLGESSRRIEVGQEEKLAIDEAFAQALTIMTGLAMREQNYMSDLFTLTKMMSMRMFLDDPQLNGNGSTAKYAQLDLETQRKPTLDLKSNKRLAQLMGILFDGLSVELNNFAEMGVKNESM